MRELILAIVALSAMFVASAGGGGESNPCKFVNQIVLQEKDLHTYAKDGNTQIKVGVAKLVSLQQECRSEIYENLLINVELVDRIEEYDLDIAKSFLTFTPHRFYTFKGINLMSSVEYLNTALNHVTQVDFDRPTPTISIKFDKGNFLSWQQTKSQFLDFTARARKNSPPGYRPLACSINAFYLSLVLKKSESDSLEKDLPIHSSSSNSTIQRPSHCY